MVQQILASLAVYFVVWWITLFAVLPFGLRTQAEDKHVILGTVESAPTKFHDPAFDLETQFYTGQFTLTLPVRLKSQASASQQAIPVDVRFQTCNGRVCQPPKTVHLSAVVNPSTGK